MLFNLVPEEQLTEFVESKDHMIILNVLKQFQEKEDVVLPALYSLHSLAGPRKCITIIFGAIGLFRSLTPGHSVLKCSLYCFMNSQSSSKESHTHWCTGWLLASEEVRFRWLSKSALAEGGRLECESSLEPLCAHPVLDSYWHLTGLELLDCSII